MKRFLSWTAAGAGSTIGWWLGSQLGGLFTALIISMILAGVGMYACNRLLQE